MSNESKNLQIDLRQSDDYELYISLITKRLVALHDIKTAKSQFVKKDKYRYVKKLNEKIEKLKRKLGL